MDAIAGAQNLVSELSTGLHVADRLGLGGDYTVAGVFMSKSRSILTLSIGSSVANWEVDPHRVEIWTVR
jgi:hypothetical protein